MLTSNIHKCSAAAKVGDHLATMNMDWKLGAVPYAGAGAESPPNTMWPGPRPTSKWSFILIHPAIWPQYTNVTDRQDRTDRQTLRQTTVQ